MEQLLGVLLNRLVGPEQVHRLGGLPWTLWRTHSGNLRDVLRELYDYASISDTSDFSTLSK